MTFKYIIAGVACLMSWGVAATSWAQDNTDDSTRQADRPERRRSLAERIPSVTSRAFEKRGRVELAPAVGLVLNDPFFNNIPVGASITYHILESLSVGVSGEFDLAFDSDVPVAGGGSADEPDVNRPVYGARLEAAWAPIYGKVSLMAERVLRFDTYISAGAGVVGTKKSGTAFAFSVALGQRYFVNRWMAVRLEVRDQFFSMARVPDEDPSESLQTLLSFTVGVSFFLPTDFRPASSVGPS